MLSCLFQEKHKYIMICSKKTILGYIMLGISITTWTTSSVAVQALQRAVPDFQLSALRYIGCIIVSVIWICIQKPTIHLEKFQYAYIIAMSTAGVFFNVCFFTAVSMLPLTNASSLTVSLRMIFFAMMTRVQSHVPLNKILIVSIVGCTAGMVFITQPWSEFINGFTPGFLSPQDEEMKQFNLSIFNNKTAAAPFHSVIIKTSKEKVVFQYLLLGYLLSIFAALADSFYILLISVYLKSVNPAVLCFLSAVICSPLSMLISFYVEQPIIISETIDIFLASTHLISTGISLVTEAAALQLLNPIVMAVITNVDSIANIIPQYTLLSSHLHGRKNILEVFGCILIAISAGLSSLSSCGYYHEDLL